MQETRVPSLGREFSLEKKVAAHSSILAWGIPMGRGAWRAIVRGVAEESDATSMHRALIVLHLCESQLSA